MLVLTATEPSPLPGQPQIEPQLVQMRISDSKTRLYAWKEAVIARLAQERLTVHESATQVLPTRCGIPWLGFVIYPTHRLLKRRNAVNFTRRFEGSLDQYQAGEISFAELDARVKGWVNHVRFGDTWGLRGYLFARHPIPRQEKDPR